MCGIVGWVDFEKDLSNNIEMLEKMTSTLSPRGPDAFGIYNNPSALLGHRRLIVVDPEGGIQPMIKTYGNNKFILIYNGELYNTDNLRDELILKGHTFYTTSDTEVLLEAYMEWGIEAPEHLNGIFAFAVWNETNRSLFLARDRFGVKPLFYTKIGSSLLFASELKALLINPLVPSIIDNEGLAEIFTLGPSRTPGNGVFKNIFELKPAHFLVFKEGEYKTNPYWQLVSLPHTDSFNDTIDKVRFLVTDAITRQLVSDVPICTFLSGGLDSSAITAIAANHFKATNRGSLHTFSIDYVNNDKYFKSSAFQPDSDASWVKKMSETFNTHHHYIELDTPKMTEALLDATFARDLPGMADIDSSLLLFCREIKKSHVVSLSGECADEIFGGYPWFHKHELLNSDQFPWCSNLNERLRILSGDVINYINPFEYVSNRYYETLEQVPLLKGEDSLNQRRREMFYLNINWFMSALLERKDRMSMATGLEVRVPYCDHRLVEYVWNIPWEMKICDNREKGILRRALEGVLPNDVLYRKKSPYPKTHNPNYEVAVKKILEEILLSGNSPLEFLINKNEVKKMLTESSDYGKPWFGQLMARPQLFAYMIQVDTWLRKYHVQIV